MDSCQLFGELARQVGDFGSMDCFEELFKDIIRRVPIIDWFEGSLELHKVILDVNLDTKLGQDFDLEQMAENFAME